MVTLVVTISGTAAVLLAGWAIGDPSALRTFRGRRAGRR
jgi:hypothetical protein